MYGVETKIDKPDVDGNGEVGILFQLCYWGRHVFMGYINYFSYVTGVGMCSWVTLTISVMLLGSARVHGLH